jgi:ADP-heptose:LPS heptosyltransferase
MKVLVYRTGHLGDGIIALPAIWSACHAFADAEFTLLSDSHSNSKLVRCAQVYNGTGIFSDHIEYPVCTGWRQAYEMANLLRKLRKRKFDLLIYLAPTLRTKRDRYRDACFFRAAGIKRLVGFDGFYYGLDDRVSSPLPPLPHESDALLQRLRVGGIDTPADGCGCMDLKLGSAEMAAVNLWIQDLPSDHGRDWLGVGPGSKMPSKVWPIDRYHKAVQKMIDRHGVWPVVFGGPEDKQAGDYLVARWACGYNAAGRLELRESAEALRRCVAYLGNDTGTMHLAAAVGTRCLAIFSSRDYPGRWYPYGNGHIVLRSTIDCEGCMLHVCTNRHNECLERITVNAVVDAAAKILQLRTGSTGTARNWGRDLYAPTVDISTLESQKD